MKPCLKPTLSAAEALSTTTPEPRGVVVRSNGERDLSAHGLRQVIESKQQNGS